MSLKKKKVEEPVEELEVVTTEEIVEEANKEFKEVTVASTAKLQLANELLAHQFNIDDTFYVTKVEDKGHSMTLGFANKDYEVTIKIKDTDEMGIIPDAQ